MKENYIFGAGVFGKAAMDHFGADTINGFIDNDPGKQGRLFLGKPVLSLQGAVDLEKPVQIIIASRFAASMEKELLAVGLTDYIFFDKEADRKYVSEELVVNPYQDRKEALTERDWNEGEALRFARQGVRDEADRIRGQSLLFNHVEIETINRCNGICSFCPVSRGNDTRAEAYMTDELFGSIIDQLEEIGYTGRLALFSNNEPLLDERIVERARYARAHLPGARLHLFTNGTLLTIEAFSGLMESLDEMVIDNYNQELKLIAPVKKIVEYCELHEEYKGRVSVTLRKPHEILTSRGGDAPNRKDIMEFADDTCVLPMKQLIIRPDGKVSLCCNDPLGKYTMGDLTKNRLLDVWYGKKFLRVRELLYEGRGKVGNCRYCDTFNVD